MRKSNTKIAIIIVIGILLFNNNLQVHALNTVNATVTDNKYLSGAQSSEVEIKSDWVFFNNNWYYYNDNGEMHTG